MSNLFVISAPSGCGKTSLVKALIENQDEVCVCVSHTTRKPRENEVNGINYFFVSQSEFQKIQAENGFLENAKVFDNYYGSAKKSVQNLLDAGKDVILEIDWQGARQVKKTFTEATLIFILPPSKAALRLRLIGRAQDDKHVIDRRMQDAVSEMTHYNEFDYLVINDDFKVALMDLTHIIKTQRLTLISQKTQQKLLLKTLV
jgi:guanylate kinase